MGSGRIRWWMLHIHIHTHIHMHACIVFKPGEAHYLHGATYYGTTCYGTVACIVFEPGEAHTSRQAEPGKTCPYNEGGPI